MSNTGNDPRKSEKHKEAGNKYAGSSTKAKCDGKKEREEECDKIGNYRY